MKVQDQNLIYSAFSGGLMVNGIMTRASMSGRAHGETGSQREREPRLFVEAVGTKQGPQELHVPMTQLSYNRFYHLPTLSHCGPSFQYVNPQGAHPSHSQTITLRYQVPVPSRHHFPRSHGIRWQQHLKDDCGPCQL